MTTPSKERTTKNENRLRYRLKNWGKVQRKGMAEAGIPLQNAQGAGWSSGGPEVVLDDDDAAETQAALARFAAKDVDAAMSLVKHFRDNWNVNVEAEVREFRNHAEREKAKIDGVVGAAMRKFLEYLP